MQNEPSSVVRCADSETQGGNEILVGQPNHKPGEPKKNAAAITAGTAAGAKGVLAASQSYRFNNCFGEDTTTEELYERTIKRLVKSSLGGVNGTVFAYGPTGSGKTFTMMGGSLPTLGLSDLDLDAHQGRKGPQQRAAVSPVRLLRPNEGSTPLTDAEGRSAFRSKYEAGDGLITMAVRDLFRQIGIEASQGEKAVSVLCSFLEIYNDQVYDLLRPHEKLSEELPVVEVNNEFFTRGETEAAVESLGCLAEHLRRGEASRQYAKTHMNHKSSRSHTIFRLKIRVVTQKEQHLNVPAHNVESLVAESVLNFVDLAGSEKLAVHDSPRGTPTKSAAGGLLTGKRDRIKETKSINKSLFFLTQVIAQLSKGCKDTHVPYRNSTLTKLLKNSLGGNARTALVLCISPAESYLPHTLSTLRFGVSARRVCNVVKTNVYESCNLASLKNQIQAYEHRINQLELDNSKQRNESEELIEMVKRLMDQKKELVERLVQLQNDPKMIASPELLSKERNEVIAQTMSIHMELEQAILKHSTVINSLSPSKPSASKLDRVSAPTILPDLKAQTRAARLAARVATLKRRLSTDRLHSRKQARLLMELLGSADQITQGNGSADTTTSSSLWSGLTDRTLRAARSRLAAAMKRLRRELLRRQVAAGVQRALGFLTVPIAGPSTEAVGLGCIPTPNAHTSATADIVDLLKSLSLSGSTQAVLHKPRLGEELEVEEIGCLGKRRPLHGTDHLEPTLELHAETFAAEPISQTECATHTSKPFLDILKTSGYFEAQASLEDDFRILPDSLHESLIRSHLRKDNIDKVADPETMLTEPIPHQLGIWVVPTLQIEPKQAVRAPPVSIEDCFKNLASRSIMVEEDDVISVVSGRDLLDGDFEFNTGAIPITAQKCDHNFTAVVCDGETESGQKAECQAISVVDICQNHQGVSMDHGINKPPVIVDINQVSDDSMSQGGLSFQERPVQKAQGSYSKFNKLVGKQLVLDCDVPPKPAKLMTKIPDMLLEKVPGHSLEVPIARQVISRSLSDHQALELEREEQSPDPCSQKTDSECNIFYRPDRRLEQDPHIVEPKDILRQRCTNDAVIVSPQKVQIQSGSKDQAKFMTPQSGKHSSVYHYTMHKQEQTGAFSFDRSSNKVHRRLDADLLRVARSPKENKPVALPKSAGSRPIVLDKTNRPPARR